MCEKYLGTWIETRKLKVPEKNQLLWYSCTYIRLFHNAKCIMCDGREIAIIIIICKRHNIAGSGADITDPILLLAVRPYIYNKL